MERVMTDLFDAQGVVNSTPSFIVLYGGRGGILQGARPPDQFQSTIERVKESAQG
jgi:hypothetical protein